MGRGGYNDQYCANARERIDFHKYVTQTHVECIGLCGIADERVDLCGHRANHAERISLCWTSRKRTLSALEWSYATQGESLAYPCGGQHRTIAFVRSLRNSHPPLHVPMLLPQRASRKCASSAPHPKGDRTQPMPH